MTLKACIKTAAKELQLLVRAEQGARFGTEPCVRKGKFTCRHSNLGEAVCCTCGWVGPYKSSARFGGKQMQGGHFVSSRTINILLEETNVHPQCSACNERGGALEDYHLFMERVCGQEEIDRLKFEKNAIPKKKSDEEIVELRSEFRGRLKLAEYQILIGEPINE